MKLNRKQVAVLWISVTVFIPVLYFALTAAANLQMKEAFWASSKLTQEESLVQRVNIIQEKRALFNKLGVFSFAWFSLTGLMCYLNNGKKD
ncbi:MAG: hypothetical protein HQL20_03290 [Candidatus Omnitrophica bacterium]|nr:hypothetical protein [Candidatus Omnitrophota bacterium]